MGSGGDAKRCKTKFSNQDENVQHLSSRKAILRTNLDKEDVKISFWGFGGLAPPMFKEIFRKLVENTV